LRPPGQLDPDECNPLDEIFLAALTDKQLRRGSHRSTRALEDARLYLATHNADPKLFVWVKTADDIWPASLASLSELLRQDTS
jgi:hypothetical protein